MPFQNYKLANNAKSTLNANIMAGATSLTVATGEGGRFPSTYPYFLTLEKIVNNIVTKREIVKVTNRTTDTFTITRSAGYCPASDTANTQTNTAFAFDFGDTVQLRLVAEHLDDINAELVALGLSGTPDATASTKGVVKLTVAPTRNLGTATMTIASPCVVSKTTHGLTIDDVVQFTTTGTLPTGIVASTRYYVISAGFGANSFQLSATLGGAPITTTGAQSGTHTLYCVTGFAVGDNDPRVPTQGENDALVGSYGTPGSGNPFVTATDPLYADNVKLTGNQTVAGIKTFSSIPVLPASDPTTDNQAVRKAYVDSQVMESSGNVGNLYYYKKGKLYYGFFYFGYPVSSRYNLVRGDATTIARIGVELGITIASSTTRDLVGPGTSDVDLAIWNGSAWDREFNAGTPITLIVNIKST